jgi:hypothetical protein
LARTYLVFSSAALALALQLSESARQYKDHESQNPDPSAEVAVVLQHKARRKARCHAANPCNIVRSSPRYRAQRRALLVPGRLLLRQVLIQYGTAHHSFVVPSANLRGGVAQAQCRAEHYGDQLLAGLDRNRLVRDPDLGLRLGCGSGDYMNISVKRRPQDSGMRAWQTASLGDYPLLPQRLRGAPHNLESLAIAESGAYSDLIFSILR